MKRKLTREEAAQVESAYAREGDEGVLFLLVRLMGLRKHGEYETQWSVTYDAAGNAWAATTNASPARFVSTTDCPLTSRAFRRASRLFSQPAFGRQSMAHCPACLVETTLPSSKSIQGRCCHPPMQFGPRFGIE